jgi:hypothetical protein
MELLQGPKEAQEAGPAGPKDPVQHPPRVTSGQIGPRLVQTFCMHRCASRRAFCAALSAPSGPPGLSQHGSLNGSLNGSLALLELLEERPSDHEVLDGEECVSGG